MIMKFNDCKTCDRYLNNWKQIFNWRDEDPEVSEKWTWIRSNRIKSETRLLSDE